MLQLISRPSSMVARKFRGGGGGSSGGRCFGRYVYAFAFINSVIFFQILYHTNKLFTQSIDSDFLLQEAQQPYGFNASPPLIPKDARPNMSQSKSTKMKGDSTTHFSSNSMPVTITTKTTRLPTLRRLRQDDVYD